jgi:hypothetical protein
MSLKARSQRGSSGTVSFGAWEAEKDFKGGALVFAKSALGRSPPLATVNDFSTFAKCYAGLTAEIGQGNVSAHQSERGGGFEE